MTKDSEILSHPEVFLPKIFVGHPGGTFLPEISEQCEKRCTNIFLLIHFKFVVKCGTKFLNILSSGCTKSLWNVWRMWEKLAILHFLQLVCTKLLWTLWRMMRVVEFVAKTLPMSSILYKTLVELLQRIPQRVLSSRKCNGGPAATRNCPTFNKVDQSKKVQWGSPDFEQNPPKQKHCKNPVEY